MGHWIDSFLLLTQRRPPRTTPTDPRFPYTTLVRSLHDLGDKALQPLLELVESVGLRRHRLARLALSKRLLGLAHGLLGPAERRRDVARDRKSTRLNSSH